MNNCSEPQNTATTLYTFLKNFLLRFHSDTHENAQTCNAENKTKKSKNEHKLSFQLKQNISLV